MGEPIKVEEKENKSDVTTTRPKLSTGESIIEEEVEQEENKTVTGEGGAGAKVMRARRGRKTKCVYCTLYHENPDNCFAKETRCNQCNEVGHFGRSTLCPMRDQRDVFNSNRSQNSS